MSRQYGQANSVVKPKVRVVRGLDDVQRISDDVDPAAGDPGRQERIGRVAKKAHVVAGRRQRISLAVAEKRQVVDCTKFSHVAGCE